MNLISASKQPKACLTITFQPETPEQRESALRAPWWEDPFADEAKRLISEEATRRGQPTPFERGANGYMGGGGYGSGWFIEFPRWVAILLREQGLEIATEYVRWTFDEGSSQDAADKLQERNPNENPCVAYYG